MSKLIIGQNDLLTLYPELATEWDFNKNSISPDQITIGSHKSVWWKCSICGHEWKAPVKNRAKGSGCRICGIKRAHDKTRLSTEDFIARLNIANPDVQVISEYSGTNNKIMCRGRKCNHEWSALPYNLLNGSGCPVCSAGKIRIKLTKSNKQFQEEIKTVNQSVIPLDEYINEKTKIHFQCKRCGNVWLATPDAVLRGQGCPACNHSNTSFFEKVIYECMQIVFPENEIVARDRKTIGLELDVFIPSMKIAIEYGAWHWHRKQIVKDQDKRDRCKDNGIRLITVFDGCGFDKDDDDILYYAKPIGEYFDFSKQVIYTILDKLGIKYHFSDKQWNTIRNNAYVSSRRKTTEELIKQVKKIDPTIIILGEYKSSKANIRVKCSRCGHIWDTKPNYLINGNGCPICNTGMKTHEEFLSVVRSKNPNIIVLGQYKGSVSRIACKCNNCGYKWMPLASYLMHGYGCPQCAKKIKLKDTEDFAIQIEELHPNIQLLETYKGSLKPIRCQCKICGNIWSPLPSNLLAGRNCPKCASAKRRMGSEAFVEEIARKSPNVIILEDYINNHTKIRCQCKKCGYQWSVIPKSLLRGYGCPKCGILERAEKRSVAVINKTTGITYRSLTQAERETGVDRTLISDCCKGKHRTAGGFLWEFYNDEQEMNK